MTNNQISYAVHREGQRHNLATEQESSRHNLATERETNRSNLASESETHRSNVARELIQGATLSEQSRHNLATEQQSRNELKETKRSNRAREKENNRSNLANEAIGWDRNQASRDVAKIHAESAERISANQISSNEKIAHSKNMSAETIAKIQAQASILSSQIAAAASKYATDTSSATQLQINTANNLFKETQNELDRMIKQLEVNNNYDVSKEKNKIDALKLKADAAYKAGELTLDQYKAITKSVNDMLNMFKRR